MRIMRFLISGGLGLCVNLGLFHVLVVAGFHYLAGSIVAFIGALIAGFLLQKYWTFADRKSKKTQEQFFIYSAVALTNLAVNTLIVYGLVEKLHTHYLVAQTLGAAVVATTSYIAYNSVIFRDVVGR